MAARGTDLLTDVRRRDDYERLVDVVLRVEDEQLLRDVLGRELDEQILADVLPQVEEIIAAAKGGRTKEEILFEQRVRESVAEVKAWEKATAQSVSDAIDGYRRELEGILGRTDWDEHRLEAIRGEMKAAKTRLDAQLSGVTNAAATEASALAIASVDGPVRAVVGNAPLPVVRIPTSQIAIIQGYTPELIQGATAVTSKRVQRVLEQKVLGGLTAQQSRERIGKLVGNLAGRGGAAAREKLDGKVFTDLQLRTETIMRTEMNRIYNLSSTMRIDDVAAKVPGVGKTWIHNPGASRSPRRNHGNLHKKVIFPGDEEKFELVARDGVLYMIDGPFDPVLPGGETINCHCRVRVAYSSEIAEEQKVRSGDFERTPSGPPPSTKKKATKKAPKKKKAAKPGELQKPPSVDASVDEHIAYQKSLVSRDLDKYPKAPDGSPRSFYQSHTVAEFGQADTDIDKLWKAADAISDIDRGDAEVLVRQVSDQLYRIAQDCERRKIPMLRGVRWRTENMSWSASMGDGVLSLDPGSMLRDLRSAKRYLKDPRAMDLAAAQKAEGEALRALGLLDDKIAGKMQGQQYSAKGIKDLKKARTQAAELVDETMSYRQKVEAWDYDKGLPDFVGHDRYAGSYAENPTGFFWRAGRKSRFKAEGFAQPGGIPRPHNVDAFGRWDEAIESTISHEFGHHVHQVTDFARTGERIRYTSWGNDIEAALKKIGRYKGNLNVSVYADTAGGREWFAENFALYFTGREDRCAKKFLKFLTDQGLK